MRLAPHVWPPPATGARDVEKPRTATPLSKDELAAQFLAAYQNRFGELPDRNRAELLLALLYIENAKGQAIIQHNWGNVSTRASADVDYWRPPWFDVDALDDADPKKPHLVDLHNRMIAGKAPSAFLALPSHEVGAHRWLGAVPKSMLAAASSGDPFAFASAYFTSRYCPDPECRDSGPSFKRLQAEIRSAKYFDSLPQSRGGAGASTVAGSSTAPAVAFLSVGVVLGIFWAVLRVRPGRRAAA